MEQSLVASVLLIMCFFGKSLTAMVERQYRITAKNYRIAEGFVTYENEEQIYCFIHCAREPPCFYVSYNDDSRRCLLSNKTNGVTNIVRDVGWNLFQHDEECPMSDDDFKTVGNHTIALCDQRLRKRDAVSACASFGRLLEIRTEEMFHEIHSYLETLPTVNGLFATFWVVGEYNSTTSTYVLPDGSPLPLTNDTWHETNTTLKCAALKRSYDYLFDDTKCGRRRSYICEIP